VANWDVIIIGLGAMGSASAYHCAKRGLRVLGLDQFAPPHTLGSSHGQTRIIREAYFEHPAYVPLVRRAYELWDELSTEAGRRLRMATGGLMIGPRMGPLASGALRSAREHGLPHEVLSAAEVMRRFPAFRLPDENVAVWEPRAGILFPEECIRAHLQIAERREAEIRCNEKVLRIALNEGFVRMETEHGVHEAAKVILAAGSWASSLLGELGRDIKLTVERQALFWFEARAPSLFGPEQLPIFILEYEPSRFFYGFPDLGNGVKVAKHHEGEATEADAPRRPVSDDEIRSMRDVAQMFLPRLGQKLLESAVCVYTNTPDEHFLIDFVEPKILLLSPCSGHGFKFSSVMGDVAADLITGQTTKHDLTLFKRREIRRRP
jgi:sarcosine oxidase